MIGTQNISFSGANAMSITMGVKVLNKETSRTPGS